GAILLTDYHKRRFYDRMVTVKGDGQRVVFRAVLKKRASDPATFYLMENKVWNDLFRIAARDPEFTKLLAKYSQPPFSWTVQKLYETKQSPDDGPLPATWVTVTEAHCFAAWMNGALP